MSTEITVKVVGGGPAPVPERQRLGRYRLLERVGEGGMGVVHRAYDEELDRMVALKIVREDASVSQEAHERLRREGRAIARLHHPNVVRVHEVGTDDGFLYLTMELVTGPTLKAWLGERDRTWQEILPVLIDAGEGLAAAHDAGLVHRDFKPANVLIGRDGRVSVADFGLARSAAAVAAPSSAHVDESGSTSLAGVTEQGALVGTPAYMAPEQHLGEPPSPRADQFAYCVTLWEAVHGARPFAGASRQELMANMARGNFTPRRRAIPGWLRRVLLRGLRAEPHRRYPSMHDLLRDLRRRPVVARWARVGLASTAAIGIAWFLGYSEALAQRRACAQEASTFTRGWNETSRAAVRGTHERFSAPGTDAVWRTVYRALDEHARELETIAHEHCIARRLRGEDARAQSEQCLADASADLTAWASMLQTAKGGLLADAVGGLALLRPPERCGRAEPSGEPEPDSASEALARARALLAFGQSEEAAVALDDLEELRPAEVAYLRGIAEAKRGQSEVARELMWEAIWKAEAASADELGAHAWVELVKLEALGPQPDHDVPRLARLALRAIERAGGNPELARSLALVLAERALAEGSAAEAIREIDRFPILAGGPRTEILVARSLLVRGRALLEQDRREEAASDLVRALALSEQLYGTGHPGHAELEQTLARALGSPNEDH